MRIRGSTLALAASMAFVVAGCSTTTVQKNLGRGVWWVCDADDDGGPCGANPEKGIDKTCFTENKSVRALKRLPDDALIVYCE